MKLEDASQPMAKPTKTENIYFSQPPSASQSWVSAYFSQSRKQVGVYLRLANSPVGKLLFDALKEQREEVDAALGSGAIWTDKNGKYGIAVTTSYVDLSKAETLTAISKFFTVQLNNFINVFRSRLEHLAKELGVEYS